MKRREFITFLGGASVAWPLAARAQQLAMPKVGFLGRSSPAKDAERVQAFLLGLNSDGYVDGKNVTIEYRWAEDQGDRFLTLAADLVSRRVAVIVAASGTISALAAKQATTSIPIVFLVGEDPVKRGLVASMNRPEGNLTGVATLNVELGAKKLELLTALLGNGAAIAVLVDPSNPNAESFVTALLAAASELKQSLEIFRAATVAELDLTFDAMTKRRIKGLVIGSGAFFSIHSERLAMLAARYALPAVFQSRDFAMFGGFMSYGGNLLDSLRLVGSYTARILNGERPADLPVQQSTKIELVINLKTAKAFGLTVPQTLLARADAVIE